MRRTIALALLLALLTFTALRGLAGGLLTASSSQLRERDAPSSSFSSGGGGAAADDPPSTPRPIDALVFIACGAAARGPLARLAVEARASAVGSAPLQYNERTHASEGFERERLTDPRPTFRRRARAAVGAAGSTSSLMMRARCATSGRAAAAAVRARRRTPSHMSSTLQRLGFLAPA